MFRSVITLLLACFAGSLAHAALVSQDSAFGANTITLDTDTGLEWLDWDLTIGLSFDEVVAELAAGGAYEGFRFATNDEVGTLWINAGIIDIVTEGPVDVPNDFARVNFLPARDLIELLGFTGLGGNLAEATTADPGNQAGTQTVAELQLCVGGPCVAAGALRNSALASLGPNDQPADEGRSIIGAALVRDTAVVPVPGALWLALSGLLVVSRFRANRRA
ncbi:MAG: hypothetical protein AAFX85_04500 [Pseudomonadota bacterium]